jgi:hypothetical protein
MISGWIDAQNLIPFVQCLGWFVDYKVDESDQIAIEFGLSQTDSEQDNWFDYFFGDVNQLRFWLAKDPNSSVVVVRVDASEMMRPRIETAVLIMQHFSVL